jgi:Protein of unknown function (DUF2905)
MRWLLTFLLVSVLLSGLWPLLKRYGIGRMPGDVEFAAFGRKWYFPLGSAVLFSFAFWAIAHFI